MADVKYLNIYLLTFNCGREVINSSAFAPHLFDALKPESTSSGRPDVLVLSLQEVAPIAHSFLGGSYLTRYFDAFRQMVDLASDKYTQGSERDDESKYVNILTRNVGLTGLMVFVRPELVGQIDGIMVAGVGVGVHETGHKGAVGARIRWRLNSDARSDDESNQDDQEHFTLTFVAAHLAPMEEALQKRHQDYKDIVKGLVFTEDTEGYLSRSRSKRVSDNTDPEAESLLSKPTTPNAPFSMVGMYTSSTHLFFAGDLNYRTSDHPPSTADTSSFPRLNVDPTHEHHYSNLRKRDQLTTALHNDETLHGLTEAPISFPPTYKLKYRLGSLTPAQKPIIDESDTDAWQWASHRWPSWCDRILFFNPPSPCEPITRNYTALPMFTTTDHRPVALSVLLPLVPMPAEAGAQLQKSAPVALDPTWKARRDTARRREIAVGVVSYLGLTHEGRLWLISSLAAIMGGLLLLREW